MSFDIEFVNGLAVLGTINLLAVIAIGTSVVRVVLRQRVIENTWRLRMARWRHQAGVTSD